MIASCAFLTFSGGSVTAFSPSLPFSIRALKSKPYFVSTVVNASTDVDVNFQSPLIVLGDRRTPLSTKARYSPQYLRATGGGASSPTGVNSWIAHLRAASQ